MVRRRCGADASGAFVISVAGSVGDEVRLQTIEDGERSTPLDLIYGGPTGLTESARIACVRLEPATHADLAEAAGSTDVRIQNDCGEGLTINTGSLRRGIPQLRITDDPSGEMLAKRAERRFNVAVDPGVFEDILFVNVTLDGGATARYPITFTLTELTMGRRP